MFTRNEQKEKEAEFGECIISPNHSLLPRTEDKTEFQAGKVTCPVIIRGKPKSRTGSGMLSSWRVGTEEPDCRLWCLAAKEETVIAPEHTLQTWVLSDV